ncbi:hypothetical protein [Geminicoccus roseus]|uniref:hypothetical protein n=1 Tax=Geminicoccus roseus TaxID=404900 RepID=UPI0012FAB3DC|nr:hypothetical protein [Geminicoccus roseus]
MQRVRVWGSEDDLDQIEALAQVLSDEGPASDALRRRLEMILASDAAGVQDNHLANWESIVRH